MGDDEAGRRALTGARPDAESSGGRLSGPRSVFAKALRDSRRAIAIAIGFATLMLVAAGAAIAAAFGTEATRVQARRLAEELPPILQGMLGPPIGLTGLGGFLEWRYYAVFFLLLPIWSILALSGTLASETERGSMELLATTRLRRRRIALEKLGAHLAGVGIVLAFFVVALVATGAIFGTLPADEIGLDQALGYTALTAVMVLLPGAAAFAAAPFLGRGAAAGVAALVMLGSYFVNAYRAAIPVFDTLAPATYFSWTQHHVPLAGLWDWPSLIAPAAIITALFAVGVVAFERRDVGSTIRLRLPGLPHFLVGLGSPFSRAFGERLPAAVAWGLGLGAYVLVLSASVPAIATMLKDVPILAQMMRLVYPDLDVASVGGLLQLVFMEFGIVIIGFAAATLASGWASDEGSGRLEVLLAAPVLRQRWAVESGLGTFAAIVVTTVVVAAGTVLGAQMQGGEIVTPAVGTFVLALHGIAWLGIGFAVGGWVRTSLAAPVIVVLTVATFLDTILAVPLKWPQWTLDLALSTHYGMPLVGDWDPAGVVAALLIGFGGLALGALGFARRDLRV